MRWESVDPLLQVRTQCPPTIFPGPSGPTQLSSSVRCDVRQTQVQNPTLPLASLGPLLVPGLLWAPVYSSVEQSWQFFSYRVTG